MNNQLNLSRREALRTALAVGGVSALGAIPAHAQPAPNGSDGTTVVLFPTFDVKADGGALGDGVTNDSAAFQMAAQVLEAAGGGTLVIPYGTYIVGDQFHVDGETPYYQRRDIFWVSNVAMLNIEGNGATLRLESGLHYGSFDPITGERFDPPTLPFIDPDFAAQVGYFFGFDSCSNVTITDLELDGNSDGLILGGQYAKAGRQLAADGMIFVQCTNVTVTGVHAHHHGRDGAIVKWGGLTESDPPTPHTFTDFVSEYNARQGLSWVGGRGLYCYNCKFNHSGRGASFSGPTAGVDIEAENSVTRDGHFHDCEFVNNRGVAMVAATSKGGHAEFNDCTFWGTTNWSLWCQSPALSFDGCNIYGSAVHTRGSDDPNLATRFIDCHFEDKPWTDGQVFRNGDLYLTAAGGNNVTWDGCTFIANEQRSLRIGDNDTTENLINCTIIHRFAEKEPGTPQAAFRGTRVSGTHFIEEFPAGTENSYYVRLHNVTVLDNAPTIVDGPLVTWERFLGLTGEIPPGTYTEGT